jgi:hypothetical protein
MFNWKKGEMRNFVVYGRKYPFIPSWYRSNYDCIDALTILEAVKKYNEKPRNEYYAYSARCIMNTEFWDLPKYQSKRMRTTAYWDKQDHLKKMQEENPHLNFSQWKNPKAILQHAEPIENLDNKFWIYFLINDEEIIYIGQAVNLITRLSYWRKKKKFPFTKFFAQKFEGTEEEKNLIEEDLILHYQPKENDNLK